MPSTIRALHLLFFLQLFSTATSDVNFSFHGFHDAKLTLSGDAAITPDGLLRLTNFTKTTLGRAFFPLPFTLTRNSSFSSTFVFAIVPVHPDTNGHGITFALVPDPYLPGSLPNENLGLFNETNVRNSSAPARIVAVELDTNQSPRFDDVDGNHVGIDVNDLRSNASEPASYIDDATGEKRKVTLIGAVPIQVWIEFDGRTKRMNVTISPTEVPRPTNPLLSAVVNVSSFLAEDTFVGFTASNGGASSCHYILGWSFALNGKALPLDLKKLPRLPTIRNSASPVLAVVSSFAALALVIAAILAGLLFLRRRREFAEILEDWEEEYGPHRFSYRDLHKATGGFNEDHFIGAGGFGKVYEGVLPISMVKVAVKRISHDSRQGMREFVAEIASMGRVRHRNLVQLLGYCRREGELLLVYDYMPNGSLERYIYGGMDNCQLDWKQRFLVIKGVASGVLYLHEEWEQVVVHRDIKASNVLLDRDFNGRIGDFGLARLHDHGANSQTTRIVGTIGYLAPELMTTGRASTSTDIYAFGAFLLEVACGRPPTLMTAQGGPIVLVDWVLECWRAGGILKVVDPKLRGEYDAEEVELVLKLGLLCSHTDAAARPSMRQVVQLLEGEVPLPAAASPESLSASSMAMRRSEGFDEFLTIPYPMTVTSTTEAPLSESSALFSARGR